MHAKVGTGLQRSTWILLFEPHNNYQPIVNSQYYCVNWPGFVVREVITISHPSKHQDTGAILSSPENSEAPRSGALARFSDSLSLRPQQPFQEALVSPSPFRSELAWPCLFLVSTLKVLLGKFLGWHSSSFFLTLSISHLLLGASLNSGQSYHMAKTRA